jgi:type 1 glutamine amidotransferase
MLSIVVGAAWLPACAAPPPAPPIGATCHEAAPRGSRVLVYTRTSGYRHASIEAGVSAIRQLGVQLGFGVDQTEEPSAFAVANLSQFGAVIFLNTTQEVLGPIEQEVFEQYIGSGGGFVGVHAAADTEYEWPWYGALVGTWFKSHPAIQSATLTRQDSTHLSTRCLPATWTRTDEWYDFRSQPPAGAMVLLTIDEESYRGGTMGPIHPVAWYQRVGEGRSWYTALGHTAASFGEPGYRDHLAGGILWVLGGNQ